MYAILPEVYDELAERVACEVGEGSYWSGSVESMCGEVRVLFRATLILYRREDRRPDGRVLLTTDVVPVWWECHTTYGADELLNDFDFPTLRNRLIIN